MPNKKNIKIKKTNKGQRGGLIKGKSHKEGGVKAVVVTDERSPVELEDKEVVITKKAVKIKKLKDYEGQKMTNREILSEINQEGGGVPIPELGSVDVYEKGGEVKRESGDNVYRHYVYSVKIMTEDQTEIDYTGDDYEEALTFYKGAEPLSETQDTYVEIESIESRYKFIGDIEDYEDIDEDYPIEDYYDEDDFYQLIQELEPEVIKSRKIGGTEEKAEELEQAIQEYLKYKYGRDYGFYKNIILGVDQDGKDRTMMIRVKDHSENPRNRLKSNDEYYLSVVVANDNATAKRWHSDSELYFSGEENMNYVKETIDEHINDICEENGISCNKLESGGEILTKDWQSDFTLDLARLFNADLSSLEFKKYPFGSVGVTMVIPDMSTQEVYYILDNAGINKMVNGVTFKRCDIEGKAKVEITMDNNNKQQAHMTKFEEGGVIGEDENINEKKEKNPQLRLNAINYVSEKYDEYEKLNPMDKMFLGLQFWNYETFLEDLDVSMKKMEYSTSDRQTLKMLDKLEEMGFLIYDKKRSQILILEKGELFIDRCKYKLEQLSGAEHSGIIKESLKKENTVTLKEYYLKKKALEGGAEEMTEGMEDYDNSLKIDDKEDIKKKNYQEELRARVVEGENNTNQLIREMIKENGLKRSKYSKSDLLLLSKYTGDNKDEGSIENPTDGWLWDFYTPDEVVQLCWRLAYKYGFRAKSSTKMLEPSCGVGRFLRYAPSYIQVRAFDIDKISATISKLLYPKFEIVNDTFESVFYYKKGINEYDYKASFDKYDIIMGNPPYVSPYNTPIFSDKEKKVYPFISNLEQWFTMRGVDSLKKGGILIYVIPSTIVDNENKYLEFKKELYKKCDMLDLYRLPQKTFEDTAINTDIIVLRRK